MAGTPVPFGRQAVLAAGAVAVLLAACAQQVTDQPDDGGEAGDGGPDSGACDSAACLRTCLALGAGGGRCVDDECACEELDGPVDGDAALPDLGPADDAGDGAPPPCDPPLCDSACRSIGASGGECVGDRCVCGGGADADADAPAEADAEARVDEAAVDDARADDGAGDDARDEAPVDEGVADEAGREDTGGATWGEPVCDTTGGTLRDRAIVGSATTLTRSLAVPDLGNGRVVRLDIEIPTRRFLGISIPFDDLQATLTSPTGEARKFWYHFEGDSSGGLFPVYDFDTPWTLPVWWDAEVGGTWTLMLRDDEFTGAGTTLSSWCLTPLDPALHASTDPGAHLGACDGEAHDITDYCEGDEPDPCTDHPVQFEMAVGDLVRAAGAARLVAEISHSDVSDLVISVVAANGTEITVWDRDPASAWTSTIALPTLDGVWLTGRWAIRIVDEVQYDTGTLNRWCIEAN